MQRREETFAQKMLSVSPLTNVPVKVVAEPKSSMKERHPPPLVLNAVTKLYFVQSQVQQFLETNQEIINLEDKEDILASSPFFCFI